MVSHAAFPEPRQAKSGRPRQPGPRPANRRQDLLDDIEQRISEDQVMGGPPKGNA